MKSALTIFFTSLSFFCFAQLNSGLELYYQLDGNAKDSTGNGSDGAITGNLLSATDRFGNIGCASKVEGYITIPYANYAALSNLSTKSNFAFSFWYKGGSAAPGDLESIFERDNNPNLDPTIFIGLYDLNKPVYRWRDSGSSLNYNFTSVVGYSDQVWHHLVVNVQTYGQWQIFLDNKSVASGTDNFYPYCTDGCTYIIGKTFDDYIDDFRFYNRTLSLNEITQLYNLTGSCGAATKLEIIPSSHRTIVRSMNVFGEPIAELENYDGLAIVFYSDGSYNKIFK